MDYSTECQRRADHSDTEPGTQQRVLFAADGFPGPQVPLQHPPAQQGKGGRDGM